MRFLLWISSRYDGSPSWSNEYRASQSFRVEQSAAGWRTACSDGARNSISADGVEGTFT